MAKGSSKADPGVEKHVQAYRHMLERVKKQLAAPQGKTLEQSLDSAKQEAVRRGELQADEADTVARFVRRDVNEAGRHLANAGGGELRAWLGIDISLIENWLLDSLLQTADKTRLEWLQLEQGARRRAAPYHAGEIAGPGLLQCTNCGEQQRFVSVARIPPCPKCANTDFTRPPG